MRSAAGLMGHSTGVFEQPLLSGINDPALDSIAGSPSEISVATASEFGGFEPFVDETVIARFLQLTPRRVLEMARDCEIPAQPIGRGTRKTWRFRLSEIDAHFSTKQNSTSATLKLAVPGATRRKQ